MDAQIRRKAPRRSHRGMVGVLYHGQMIKTHYQQIGEGGALIELKAELESAFEGEQMVLTLFLPGLGAVVSVGECVYRKTDKIGIQFNDLRTEFKVKLREFVSRRKVIEA